MPEMVSIFTSEPRSPRRLAEPVVSTGRNTVSSLLSLS